MENERLVALHKSWVSEGSKPQESFAWARSVNNWKRDLGSHSRFIQDLPGALDRTFLRKLVADDSVSNVEKFLAIMIWGYGDLGYGSFRVKKMVNSPGFSEKVTQVYESCQRGEVLEAYLYLSKNRIEQLGPAFGTKLICFFTPREFVAPIYDSFISKWMEKHAKNAFLGQSTSSEVWSKSIFTSYLAWVDFHVSKLNCFSDDLELLMFRDSLDQFSNTSSWSGQ